MTHSSAVLSLLARVNPKSAPAIAILQRVLPLLERFTPVIKLGLTEGPSAIAAAEKAAPELAMAIRDATAELIPGAQPEHVETVTRILVGHPTTAFEREQLGQARASQAGG